MKKISNILRIFIIVTSVFFIGIYSVSAYYSASETIGGAVYHTIYTIIGNPLFLSARSNNHLVKYTKHGKSVQEGTPTPSTPSEIKTVTGVRNLFDGELELGTINDNTGEKEAATTNIRSKNYIEVEANKEYIITNDYATPLRLYLYDKNYNFISISETSWSYPNKFVLPNNCKYVLFRTRQANSITDLNMKVMFEFGSVVHNYVPYGTWLETKLTGKNIFDKNNLILGYFNSRGEIIESVSWSYMYLNVLPNTNYYISGTSSADPVPQVVQFDQNFNFIGRIQSYRNGGFTTDNKAYYIGISVKNSDFDSYQIERGEKTTYEPYKEQTQLIDMNIYENGSIVDHYELAKVGDVEDTIEDNILHKRIGKIVLDGNEDWYLNKDSHYIYRVIDIINALGNYSNGISNYFVCKNSYPSKVGEFAIREEGTSLQFYSSETTIENFKSWLSENPVTVYYVLAEPYDIELNIIGTLKIKEGHNHFFDNDNLKSDIEIKHLP